MQKGMVVVLASLALAFFTQVDMPVVSAQRYTVSWQSPTNADLKSVFMLGNDDG